MQKRTYHNLQEEQAVEMPTYPQNIPVGEPVHAFNPHYPQQPQLPPHPYPQQPPQAFIHAPPPPPMILNDPRQMG